MEGLHIILFTVQELHTLVEWCAHDSQLGIGSPSLKQSLFSGQGILAREQWSIIENVWQVIQGFLICHGCWSLQNTNESRANLGLFLFRDRLSYGFALTFEGSQMLSQFDHSVQVALCQRNPWKRFPQGFLGRVP